MDVLMNYPVIPGVTFLLLLAFFLYQLREILKERKKAKTPKLSSIMTQAMKHPVKAMVPPVLVHNTPEKPIALGKRFRRVTQFLTGIIFLLVLASTAGIVYFYRNQSIPFTPRASSTLPTVTPLFNQSVTVTVEPTMSTGVTTTPLQPTKGPTIQATITPTPIIPTNRVGLSPLAPAATGVLQPSITVIPTYTPTPAPSITVYPTKITSATPTPVFLASGGPSVTPTGIVLSKPSPTIRPLVSPTVSTMVTTTPQPTPSTIPAAGLPWYLVTLILGSLIFLFIGFVW